VEVETSNFIGTVNTTLSSGVTVRTERDCKNLDGFTYTGPVGTYVDGSGEGCATALVDSYGNVGTQELSRSSGLSDDGNMNFKPGAVVTATQKFYTEILGKFNNGDIGLNLSFTGRYDPALDINKPTYAPLTSESENDFESGIDLLNAYVYGTTDFNNSYVDWTIGRQVTNWGEATFIPIGMNGFTTNALDLTKLRGPGSTIREALVPASQITVSTPLANGINIEGFVQFEHRAVSLDPAGSFYGNEIVGDHSTKMITSGNYNRENKFFDDCNFSKVGTDITACDAAAIAEANTTAGDQTHGVSYLLTKGLQAVSANEMVEGQDFGAAKTFGNAGFNTFNGNAWTDLYTSELNQKLGSATATGQLTGNTTLNEAGGVDRTFFSTNDRFSVATAAGMARNSASSDSTGILGQDMYSKLDTDVSDDSINTYSAVSVRRQDDFVKEARSNGQFGLRLSGYSDAGEGLDWSLNFSRYHSKTPYVRIQGKGGMYSGDIYGLVSRAGDIAEADRSASQVDLVTAIQNTAYSAGVCGAAFGAALANATFDGVTALNPAVNAFRTTAQAARLNYDGTTGNWFGATTAQRALSNQFNWQDTIDGNLIHNSAKCSATADLFTGAAGLAFAAGDTDVNTDMHAALTGVAEVLVSAITPLNMAKFELIYPEDLNALGLSFNTNIAGTAIQGEITYRPDFPLAHGAGDQLAQIGDVSGAFDMLDMFAFDTVAAGTASNTNTQGTDIGSIFFGTPVSPNFYNHDTTGMTAAEIFQQGQRMELVGLATYDAGTGTFSLIANNSGTLVSGDHQAVYHNWMASTNTSNTALLGLATVRKGVHDAAYVAICMADGNTQAVCGSHTIGTGNYNAGYAALSATAYEQGTVNFNRSSLRALTQDETRYNDYYSTPFVKKDVFSYDIASTTTFSASHPITQMLGADSSVFLTEVGAVAISGLNNAADGYIARNGYQEGIGQEKCNGPFGALVAGGTNFGGAGGALTHLGAGQVDALFGNGGYCEDQSGADAFSMSYRMIGSATYNNFSNSGWSISPSVVWAHDPYGYGPASLGGFVEDKMTMSLGLNARKGSSITLGLNYTAHLEGPEVSASTDKDTLTASMSYSF